MTRELRNNDLIGPAEEFDVRNTDLPVPAFHELSVEGHKVTVRANNCNELQWIANGKVIANETMEQSETETTYVLDLDTIEDAENFLYIRCELFGEGGATISQALVIDDGTAPKTYVVDTSAKAKRETVWHKFTSLRLIVLFKLIVDELFSR